MATIANSPTDIESGKAQPPTAQASPIPTTTQATTHARAVTPTPVNRQALRTSGNAVASLVCGIIGLFFFGVILGPIAICLGSTAKKEINGNSNVKGDCQATSGIILGVIDTVLGIVLIIYVLGQQ